MNSCERKPYPERKSCGFENIRIRVDVAWVGRVLARRDTRQHNNFSLIRNQMFMLSGELTLKITEPKTF